MSEQIVYPVNLRYSSCNTCVMEYFTADLRLVTRKFFCNPGLFVAVRKSFWSEFAELASSLCGTNVVFDTRANDISCENKILLHKLFHLSATADDSVEGFCGDEDDDSAAVGRNNEEETDCGPGQSWLLTFLGTKTNEQAGKLYRILRENCQYSDQFAVLPERSLEVDVALEAFLDVRGRLMRSGQTASNPNRSGSGSLQLPSLTDAFTMMRWCTISGGRVETLRLCAPEQEASLIDPVKYSPIVSFDIEVVCDELNQFPVGMYPDEQISSISAVVTYPDVDGEEVVYARRNVVYVLKPFWYEGSLSGYDSDDTRVLWFDCERDLIERFMTDLETNALLEDVSRYGILVGYNSDLFDMVYLSKRIWFHDIDRFAGKIFTSTFAPAKFRFSHRDDAELGVEEREVIYLYVDLFKIVSNHMAADLSNKKLSTVAKKFGKGTHKVDMNPTAIRFMYSKKLYRDERAMLMSPSDGEVTTSVGEKLPTMGRVIKYNIVDSEVVLDVIEKQSVVDMVLEFSRMTITNGFVSMVRGKSHLTNRLMTIEYLQNDSFIGNLDCTSTFRRLPAKWMPLDEQGLQHLNDGAISQLELLRFGDKRFGGGANDAVPGIFVGAGSGDYKSFYPSMAAEKNFGLTNTAVLDSADVFDMFGELAFAHPELYGLQQYCDAERVLRLVNDDDDYDENSKGNVEFNQVRVDVVPLPKFGECDRYVFVDLGTESLIKRMFERLMSDRDVCKRLKSSDPAMVVRERVLKLIVNSAYGTLGYERSVTKAAVVAAAITNGCRIQINETCRELVRRGLKPIYVDTDGVFYVPTKKFFYANKPNANNVQLDSTNKLFGLSERLTESENVRLCDLVTETIGSKKIIFEPEKVYDLIVVMARKTYMYVNGSEDGTAISVTCKGFEKNAPPLVKEIFQRLAAALYSEVEKNFSSMSGGIEFPHGASLTPADFDERQLAFAVFNFLDGRPADSFKKEVSLNERSVGGSKTRFIEECVRKGHQRGSRIDYLDVLDRLTGAEEFCVADEYDERSTSLAVNLGLFVKNHFGYMSKCLGVSGERRPGDSNEYFFAWLRCTPYDRRSKYDVWFSAPSPTTKPIYENSLLLLR